MQRGWLNYFRGTSIQGKLRDIDGWLRNRLRYCIWTDWKNCSEAKITNTKKQ
ncbi:group II intron maturase-specific domain-containing protein [Flavobacterium gawalongense]|uniref:group II intron maturase-specific domain-containing protein n=1 Tax=Flavobacterium gawalongense TaxID=2594432 RepID=UPI003743F64C